MSTEPKPDSFTFRAAELIRSIPKGKVATYGQIAAMAGDRLGAREVVRVLHTQKNLPWHRVLAAGGRITLPGSGGALQRKLIEVGGHVHGATRGTRRGCVPGVRFNADGTTPPRALRLAGLILPVGHESAPCPVPKPRRPEGRLG